MLATSFEVAALRSRRAAPRRAALKTGDRP